MRLRTIPTIRTIFDSAAAEFNFLTEVSAAFLLYATSSLTPSKNFLNTGWSC